jgi:CRISPR-associated protein Csb1
MSKTVDMNELARKLLAENGPAAIVAEEWLRPVDGQGAVVFPPTYAGAGASVYNIDDNTPHGKMVTIDSIPSQANRIEPLFRKSPYDELVPQITIEAGDEERNLLEVGHRAADAFVRYSELGEELQTAFLAYKKGDAVSLAKIAPTTLIFGGWDSRDTQAKCPRMLASEIRGYDVCELSRSSTYMPPVSYKDLSLLEENYGDKALSELGFLHAPATHQLGGILVNGDIRRKTVLNLTTLRDVGGDAKLHRYFLGLALVAFVHAQPYNLRQGCLLVRDAGKKPITKLVNYDGTESDVTFDASAVLAYAQDAARAFHVAEPRTVAFDACAANTAIKERGEKDQAKAKKVDGRKRQLKRAVRGR